MYSKDHPDEWDFVRPGEEKPLSHVEMLAAMEARMLGKGNEDFWSKIKPSKAVLARAEQIAKAGQFLMKSAEK